MKALVSLEIVFTQSTYSSIIDSHILQGGDAADHGEHSPVASAAYNIFMNTFNLGTAVRSDTLYLARSTFLRHCRSGVNMLTISLKLAL